MATRSLFGGLSASLLIDESAVAQPNLITSTSWLWLEWDVTPNIQWVPGSADPQANLDRTRNVFNLQVGEPADADFPGGLLQRL